VQVFDACEVIRETECAYPDQEETVIHRHWRMGPAIAALAVALVLVAGAQAGPTPQLPAALQLSDPALASYRGGTAGLAPTNPAALGKTRLDPSSDASTAYLAYLAKQHAAFQLSLTKALGRTVEMPITPFHSRVYGLTKGP
jgi:hypothetical protein